MRLVELTRDLRPWRAGDSVPLADDVAEKLVASGEGCNLRPFPPEVEAPAVAPPDGKRPVQRYHTRKRG